MPRMTAHLIRKLWQSNVSVRLFKTAWSRLRPRRSVSIQSMFDRDWYLNTYPDVLASGIDPIRHYEKYGAAEGRDPSPDFNTRWYLENYPDVAAAGINPLRHYILYGRAEGRAPRDKNAKPDLAPLGPTNEAIDATWDVIQAFSHVEPDLSHLDKATLYKLPIAKTLERPLAEVWRKLYLSISTLPRYLIVVPSLDGGDSQRLLTGIVNHATGYGILTDLLVIAVDETVPSIASSLPVGTPWRSLAEFHPGLTLQQQSRLLSTFIHTLRPESVIVIDSNAGLDVLSKYSNTMQNYSRLFVASSSIGDERNTNGSHDQIRQLAKYLDTLYVVKGIKEDEILGDESHPLSDACRVQILPQTASEEELQSILMREAGLFDKVGRSACA